jgi:NADH-quinone oxidoreductase B subunit
MKPRFEKSPWVVHFNCNSCNGCDIELLACLSPLYDLERFGIVHVGNPKHADVLLVTGSVNHRNARVLRNVYDQMPEPKVVVAIGACAGTGGIFKDCYNVLGGVDKVVPVDVYLAGCPVRPQAMIDGVLEAARKLDEKRRGVRTTEAVQTVVRRVPSVAPAAPGSVAEGKAQPATVLEKIA